jgi:hypothetical protein
MTPYQEIRDAGKAMVGKVLEATTHLEFNPLRIAKRLTLPVAGRTLVFDGEVAQNAFFDFWLHEYRVNGKSLVASVDPVAAGLEPLEIEVLEAHRQARTSFLQRRRCSLKVTRFVCTTSWSRTVRKRCSRTWD